MRVPRLDKRVAQVPARLDEKRARAHGRVTDLEIENALGSGRPPARLAQSREDRFERRPHDGPGKLARRVVGARAPPLLARLEHHRPLRHEIGGGIGVDHRSERRVEILEGLGRGRRLLHLVGELSVRPVQKPLRALRSALGEKRVQVHGGGRTVLLLRLDRHGAAGRRLEPKTHHRFVDRTNLLDVERPIRDSLTVEDEELLQRPVDRAVGDERRGDPVVDLSRAFARASLEKREAIGIEEHAVARREAETASSCAVVNHAEERQKLCPGAVSLVHRIRVKGGIFAKPLVEPRDRVVARERFATGEHLPLLGVEEKDDSQDYRE